MTGKNNPKVVNHEPAHVQPARYEDLAEGGSIDVSPQFRVNAGVDNVGGRGMFSILEGTNPDDAPLLQAFGRGSSDLVDRDRNLIFVASPAQLLVVEDGRSKGEGLHQLLSVVLKTSAVFIRFAPVRRS